MCGNDLSSIVSPTTDFYTLVSTQVPSAKINIRSSILIKEIIHSTQRTPTNSKPWTSGASNNYPSPNAN